MNSYDVHLKLTQSTILQEKIKKKKSFKRGSEDSLDSTSHPSQPPISFGFCVFLGILTFLVISTDLPYSGNS